MIYDIWLVFFFKQKTADEMRISDWSSDVCSSDLSLLSAVLRLRADISQGGDRAHFSMRIVITSCMTWARATELPVQTTSRNSAAVDTNSPLSDIPGHSLRAQVLRCDRSSEERRVGKECVSTMSSGGTPYL